MAGTLTPSLQPFGEHPLVRTGYESHKDILFEKQKGHCYYCGKLVTKIEATIDHIIPLAKNGANRLANKVLACRSCNHQKDKQWPYSLYYEARALWITQGPGWIRLRIEYRPYKEAALKMGDAELKQELNDMPIGTTIVKTKKGWSFSICNTHTRYERISVKAVRLDEGLLEIKAAYINHMADKS